MFSYAMRVAKEQEAMLKAQTQAQSDESSQPLVPVKLSQSLPSSNDKASNSARTALPKEEEEVKVQPKSPIKSPVDKTQKQESIEEFTAIGDTNDKGEPLYENINASEELPAAPRPSVSLKLRTFKSNNILGS